MNRAPSGAPRVRRRNHPLPEKHVCPIALPAIGILSAYVHFCNRGVGKGLLPLGSMRLLSLRLTATYVFAPSAGNTQRKDGLRGTDRTHWPGLACCLPPFGITLCWRCGSLCMPALRFGLKSAHLHTEISSCELVLDRLQSTFGPCMKEGKN
jgi:hypothetical protein